MRVKRLVISFYESLLSSCHLDEVVFQKCKFVIRLKVKVNWASEASPTLRCSIEISRNIYMSVVSNNALAELSGPNTRMLKVRFGQLKPTYDTSVIRFDYTLELL